MKKNLSFTFKTIAFALFFLFSSCSEDVYNSTQNQNSKYISIQSKKFSDLKFDSRFAEPYALVKNQLENNSALNRSMFGVEVDTTIVNEVLHEDFTTYSLLIKNESENTSYYENLAIKIDEQNQTSAAILKYNIDDQKNIVSMETNPVYGEFIETEDNSTSNNVTNRCQLIQIIVEHPCTVGKTHTNGEPFGCSMEGNNAHSESFWLTVCSGGESGPLYPQQADPSGGPSDTYNPTGGGYAPVPITNAKLFFNSLNILQESKFQILNTQALLTLVNFLNNNPYNTFTNFNIKKFFNDLSLVKSEWFQNQSDQTQTNIIEYLAQNNFDNNSNAFVNSFMTNAINSNLNLDFKKSLKSPANIDVSEIDSTSVEGQKFNCVYKKLMQSPSFKNLFDNTFGGNQEKLNVKFEISDDLPSTWGGATRLSTFNGNYTNTIRINKNILMGTHSNMLIAKTILHECIHAYLNIKNINASLGSTIPELNNLDLQEIIGTFYQGFGGILVGGVNQTQHAFIFDYMTPVMITILEQIKNDLIADSDIIEMETNPNAMFYNPITGLNEPFNWDDLFFNLVISGLENSVPFINTIVSNELKSAKYVQYLPLAINLTKICN